MQLLQEMKQYSFPINQTTTTIRYRVFGDNSESLEIGNSHKYRPHTKHLNAKLYHFRDYITQKDIYIEKITQRIPTI